MSQSLDVSGAYDNVPIPVVLSKMYKLVILSTFIKHYFKCYLIKNKKIYCIHSYKAGQLLKVFHKGSYPLSKDAMTTSDK